ncbi:MAG TPA: hypothetical protein VF659_24215 [Pyrinomonadaceae bacterium]|jgi:hypothetical protein
MSLRRRVEALERGARQRQPPAPVPFEGNEEERLRLVMELFALGTLRLRQVEEWERGEQHGVMEVVPSSAVESLSDEELLSILGFPDKETFVLAEDRLRKTPPPDPEEVRPRLREKYANR